MRAIGGGGDGWSDPANPMVQFKEGNYEPIIQRYEALAATVSPRGILGPPEEKEYWSLFQYMVSIALARGETELALERLANYEEGRVAVKLTPIPEFTIQEAILGYLADSSVERARNKLQFWLSNSRMPCISDVIRNHPAFADLFEASEQQ